MIIGIGGVSRSGKTTLANQLKIFYQNKGRSVLLLSQDDYVVSEELIPKIKDRIDWELPQTIDLEKLMSRLEECKTDILIIEGLFAFAFDKLNEYYDFKIFIKIKKETFLYRKSIDTRYNEPQWFIQHIWQSYLKYGTIDEADKSYQIIDGEKPININKEKLFFQ